MDKNKQILIIGGSVLGLLVIAVGVFLLTNQKSDSGTTSDETATTGTTAGVTAPGGVAPAGGPMMAQTTGTTPGGVRKPAGGGAPTPKPRTSWDGDPSASAQGSGGAVSAPATAQNFSPASAIPGMRPGGAMGPMAGGGMPGMMMGGGGMGAGGGASAATTAEKNKPIQNGVMVARYRPDPFVTLRRVVVERTPAYTLAAPTRLAPPALPFATPPPSSDPNERLGPLPPVTRRVAGVLYNGAITAILETGNAPDSDVRVVQPGARVPSGIPGIPDLTIDSIAMDQLTLRAQDGRTVPVKLSGLPPAVVASLQSQFGNNTGGNAGPGFGGPTGFGGPGAGAGAGGGGARRNEE